MNWWTLLPMFSPRRDWTRCGYAATNQATEQAGLGVPMGPTWSHLKYGLMMFADHHCYSLTWIIMRISNLCIAWEMPGISGNYLAVSVKKKVPVVWNSTTLFGITSWSSSNDGVWRLTFLLVVYWDYINHPESHKLTQRNQRNRRFSVVQAIVKNPQNHQKALDVYGFE